LSQVKNRIAKLRSQGPWPKGLLDSLIVSFGLKRHLQRVRTYLSCREEMREYSTRCYYLVRMYVLEAGNRLVQLKKLEKPQQIFMLHTDEILDCIDEKTNPTEVIARCRYRHALYQGYRKVTPPNELGRGVLQNAIQIGTKNQDGRSVLLGVGCSPGTVVGTARVIESLNEMGKIQSGDILVTRFTDPGWTPVLGMVSGIVTEVGGVLSHAAVISREYGIPAVLNLPGVTKVLQTGMKIRLDGSTGEVELLDSR
jgi:phosphoenolpyruvate synthase/pyruvate phosphate dikinase